MAAQHRARATATNTAFHSWTSKKCTVWVRALPVEVKRPYYIRLARPSGLDLVAGPRQLCGDFGTRRPAGNRRDDLRIPGYLMEEAAQPDDDAPRRKAVTNDEDRPLPGRRRVRR